MEKRKSSVNTFSHDAPTVSARFIYGYATTHDSSATIHHCGATNAHDASTILYGANLKIEILAIKKIFPILYLDLKKDPKMHRNDPYL